MTTAEEYPSTTDTTLVGLPPWELADRGAAQARQTRRGARYEQLRWLWTHSSLPRLHHCRLHAFGTLVPLRVDVQGAWFGGLQTCGSIWACPMCSALIRTRRAVMIEDSVRAWLSGSEGHSVVFLTLTVRHHRGQALRDVYGGLSAAWKRLRCSRWWQSQAWSGYWRSAEVTHGVNGWHPHLHLLLFSDRGRDVAALNAELTRRWQSAVVAAGLEPTTLERGAVVQAVTVHADGAALGAYLSKVLDEGDERSIGDELARSDTKRSKRGESPMQLLQAAAAGSGRAAALWHEYEQATFGRRAIESSRGMKQLTGVDVDQEDEDLADEGDGGEIVEMLHRSEYGRLARSGVVPWILDRAESDDPIEVVRLIHQLLAITGNSPP